MKIASELIEGRLVRRYKRFLSDVILDGGEMVTAHTPNTGSMLQCAVPGSRVLVSLSDNPSRKLSHTLELVRVGGRWVDINTHRTNRVVEEGLRKGLIRELSGYNVRPEFRFNDSRIDFLLTKGGERILMEVKNVSLLCDKETACFPDAVTERGRKHLSELIKALGMGYKSVIFFLVQRREAKRFRPADNIDPLYGRLLRKAVSDGVTALAYKTSIRRPFVSMGKAVPVILD